MVEEKDRGNLVFACRWNRNEIKSWSGTAYAVYKELEKVYVLERFDIKDTLDIRLFKGLRKLGILKGEPSLLKMLRINGRDFKETYGEQCRRIFQFAEVPWTAGTQNYIYQDLNASYLLYLRKMRPQVYAYSDYCNISRRELEKREVIQREFYEHCECIFTMGQWLADFIKEEYSLPDEKVVAVGAGINVSILPADYTEKRGNKILFVGRDFRRKGGELLLDAFRIVKEKMMPEAELYIVGPKKNPMKRPMDGVTFLGELEVEELQGYFKRCDIFCMPSYFEPFGIVFGEALVNGLPCIARNDFAMKEIIEDGKTGYLIDSDNPELLAEKISRLLKNEEIVENVRKRREFYIEKYSWENVVEKMVRHMG